MAKPCPACGRLAHVLVDSKDLTGTKHSDRSPLCLNTMSGSCTRWAREASIGHGGAGCGLALPQGRITEVMDTAALRKGRAVWPIEVLGTNLGIVMVIRQVVHENGVLPEGPSPREQPAERFDGFVGRMQALQRSCDAVERELAQQPNLKLAQIHECLHARGEAGSLEDTERGYRWALFVRGGLRVTSWLLLPLASPRETPAEVLTRIDGSSSAASRDNWVRAAEIAQEHERWYRKIIPSIPHFDERRLRPGGAKRKEDSIGAAIALLEAKGLQKDEIVREVFKGEARSRPGLSPQESGSLRERIRKRVNRR